MELLRFVPAVVLTALGLYLWLFALPIFVLNLDTKTFRLDDCGYKTSSTTRTLNAYRDELTARGFTCSRVR